MCCGRAVAYYVECTNVVKKWYGSDCVNRGYQGRRGWFFKLATLHLTSSIEYFQLCEHDSEREEESAEFKNM